MANSRLVDDERIEEASAAWKYTEPCREEPHEEGRLFSDEIGDYRARNPKEYDVKLRYYLVLITKVLAGVGSMG